VFGFSKKTPEEKEAARLEKLRRTEGERAFGGALMTPAGELALADICMVRLNPERQALTIACQKRELAIPYAALRGMVWDSEVHIALGEGSITKEEMERTLDSGADAFVGALNKNADSRARWFIRLDYTDAEGEARSLLFIAYSMRGFYVARSPLYAAVQFEETVRDILTREDQAER
jgi:hypothetical protein